MMPTDGAARVELEDVVKAFPNTACELAAVRGVSLRIQAGEVFGIIGESGAGKSTLLRLMNFLERPTSGRVLIDGEDLAHLPPRALRRLRRRIGMIFQHFNLLHSKTVLAAALTSPGVRSFIAAHYRGAVVPAF